METLAASVGCLASDMLLGGAPAPLASPSLHESSHLLKSKQFFFAGKFSIEGKQKEMKGYLDRDLPHSHPSMTESFE